MSIQQLLDIFEVLLFFLILAVTFKAFMSLDITKHFRKGSVWQIQIVYIFASIALSYLVLKAFMNLIELFQRLFN